MFQEKNIEFFDKHGIKEVQNELQSNKFYPHSCLKR